MLRSSRGKALFMSPSVLQNSTNSTLTAIQLQVANAIAHGVTHTAAAKAAGVHRTTLYHWLRTVPEFQTAIREARNDYSAALRDELQELASLALTDLRSLLADPNTPAAVRLRTSLAILERAGSPWTLPVPDENAEIATS